MHFKLELFKEMIEGFLIRLGKVQIDTYTVLIPQPKPKYLRCVLVVYPLLTPINFDIQLFKF